MVSVTTTQFCFCCMKTAINNIQMSKCNYFPIKLYLQKQAARHAWPMTHAFQTPGLRWTNKLTKIQLTDYIGQRTQLIWCLFQGDISCSSNVHVSGLPRSISSFLISVMMMFFYTLCYSPSAWAPQSPVPPSPLLTDSLHEGPHQPSESNPLGTTTHGACAVHRAPHC